MKQCLIGLLSFMLMVSHSSCYKPAPAPEEIKSQEETTKQEEVERALRINELYPFSFKVPSVKTYWYDAERIWYGFDGDWFYYTSSKDDENWICRSRLDGSDKTWIASLEYPKDAYWFVTHDARGRSTCGMQLFDVTTPPVPGIIFICMI